MITLIAAVAKNGCIGANGELPWHYPEDMKRFKELTMNNVVLMGRKTWESIPEKFRPLPNRKNIVITRQPEYEAPGGVEVHRTIEAALAHHADENVFVIGGAEIYRQTIDLADRLEITQIHKEYPGDTFFPTINPALWEEVKRDDHDEFSFITYERKL